MKTKPERGTVRISLEDYKDLKTKEKSLSDLIATNTEIHVPVMYESWSYLGYAGSEIILITKDEALLALRDECNKLRKENYRLEYKLAIKKSFFQKLFGL
jgi:hypothetical protein